METDGKEEVVGGFRKMERGGGAEVARGFRKVERGVVRERLYEVLGR